jgi:hypothetical protein
LNLQVFCNFSLRSNSSEALFPASDLDSIIFAENFKQGFVFKVSLAESAQINIGQEGGFIKDRNIVY